MDIRYLDIKEQDAFEQGYLAAITDLKHQLQHSKDKLLNMMFETEPFTSQRRMLLACHKLLEIYSRHYEKAGKIVETSASI